MDKIFEIIKQISATSGRNDKEEILKLHKDNELFKKVLKFVYDPFIITGLSSKKINKKINSIIPNYLENLEMAMEYLKLNNSGRDVDIVIIQNFMKSQNEELKEFLKQVFTKELKIGVTGNTLNKIYGKGFVPSFSCMLAEKYFDNEHRVTGEFIITTKLDGCRAILCKEDGVIKIFSRTGQPYEGLTEIENEALNLPEGIVLDGELILRNDKGLNSADLFRETQKVVRKDGIKKNIEFHVFDGLTVTSLRDGFDKGNCKSRKLIVEKYIKDNSFTFIKYVTPLYIGKDKSVISELLSEVISQGHEGLMLNIADAPYECKRTKTLLKIKQMQTVDLRVIGFEEGTGRNVGKLGRVNVDYKGYSVGVGSGFTDQDREEIWKNQDEYIGKIMEISYFEESSNQEGGISLRFPIFKGWRFDKDEPSLY